jgi:transcriptional pleiotropic regulator of transition state genes
MKSTGIVRPVDNLGRIVLPIELRRMLDIDKDSTLEIYVNDESIVLKKYQPACIFCGSAESITQYQGRNICACCRHSIAQIGEPASFAAASFAEVAKRQVMEA